MGVVPCRSALDAITCITAHQPHVVILDLQLNSITGVDVLHQLRAGPTTQALAVIFCSGSGDRLWQLLPVSAAHDACLVVKPDVQQLRVRVQHPAQ